MSMHPESGRFQQSDIALRYLQVRGATEALAQGLSAEDCALQSMPDASPVKWHLAHTTWFFETFILEAHVPGYRAFDPAFRVLFNSYYNAVGEKHPRPERGMLSRPRLEDVLAYRRHVDQAMQSIFADPGLASGAGALLELGMNHEQQHQELILTDVKHLLWQNPLRPAYHDLEAPRAPESTPELKWKRFEDGLYEIGFDGAAFSFDNETPRHWVQLQGFEIASRPVTVGDYLAFMADGGYEQPLLWLADGWGAVREHGWRAPLYWEQVDGEWMAFTLGGLRKLNPSEPLCHVSFYEADAFATWAGGRLPREEEWEVAAAKVKVEGNFVESGYLHPAPADGAEDAGLEQMFGDVWEWTRSPYVPYPRFKPAGGALGEYNGKFMANQMVLRGGSVATPVSHIRATYRNFFYPIARWQFSGLRLAKDA